MGTRPRDCEPLERRQHLDGGQLDPTFSGDGIARGLSGLTVRDMAVQSSGKSVVVGFSSSSAYNGKLVAIRYNIDGTLDTSFGTNGVVAVSLASYFPAEASSETVVIQPDDKILVAGNGKQGTVDYTYIARLNINGSLDTTWDGDGIVRHATYDGASIGCSVRDMVLQRDGKLVIVGTGRPSFDDYNSRFGVARFNTNGSYDSSFDDDGHRYVSFTDGKLNFGVGIAIDYSGSTSSANYGKILVIGSQREDGSSNRIAMARLTTGGTLDNSFDGDGRILANFGPGYTNSTGTCIFVLATGKYVIGAAGGDGTSSAARNAGLLRFNANGSLDTTFGNAGRAEIDRGGEDTVHEIIIGQTGRFLAVGGNAGQMAITSINADGTIDTSYGSFGTKSFELSSGVDAGVAIARAPSGKLYAAGGRDAQVVRFNDRKFATVTLGSFDSSMTEEGDPFAFFVGRIERLSIKTTVRIAFTGTATPPGVVPARPFDFTGDNLITFGNNSTTYATVDIPSGSTFVAVTLSPFNDGTAEGDEQITMRIVDHADYDTGNQFEAAFVLRDNDQLAAAPVVTGASFDYLTGPQSLSFKFDSNVGASLTDADIVLTGPAGMPTHAFAYDAIQNTATLRFNGILPDGNYTAKVVGAGVTNASGKPMASDYTLPFHFLNADGDRDRKVDFDDLLVLSQNYGLEGQNFAQGNFDYSADGLVGFDDLLLLAQRYGKTLPALANAEVSKGEPVAAKKRSAWSSLDA